MSSDRRRIFLGLGVLLIASVTAVAIASPNLMDRIASEPLEPEADQSGQSGSVELPAETANERLDRLLPAPAAVHGQMESAGEPVVRQRLLTQSRHDGHVGLFGSRPDGYRPAAIVIHATGSGRPGSEFTSLDRLGDYFQRQGIAASHYAIDRTGHIVQFVSVDSAAFHVSKLGWNGISIGIELLNDNTGTQPFPSAQLHAARRLVRHLGARYGIPVEAVVQHRDIQPQDRRDPADNFGWEAFTRSLQSDGASAPNQSRRSAAGVQRLEVD